MNDHDEETFGNCRKEFRKERKRLSAKDRSKFKKTDIRKYQDGVKQELQTKLLKKDLLKGRVLSITSQGTIVDTGEKCLTCSLRGLLKREKTHVKNLVIVGDYVLVEEGEDKEGSIADVMPRKSILSRADSLSRRKEQLIAANIDQVLIIMSVLSPTLKSSLIDRYIIAAKKGNMEPVVIVNKIDLLEKNNEEAVKERELLECCRQAYSHEGIPFLLLSASTGKGLDELRAVMKDKASVFSGQSGTGKSSLINALTGLQLPVNEMVKKTKKGAHTTTRAQLIPLKFGGWCVDTPGIKSFGVWDLKPEELKGYFSEIEKYGQNCKFLDCSHLHEKGCAVLEALEKGELLPLRYESYKSLRETIIEQHERR
jgi:ribosome biogenesis GTPase